MNSIKGLDLARRAGLQRSHPSLRLRLCISICQMGHFVTMHFTRSIKCIRLAMQDSFFCLFNQWEQISPIIQDGWGNHSCWQEVFPTGRTQWSSLPAIGGGTDWSRKTRQVGCTQVHQKIFSKTCLLIHELKFNQSLWNQPQFVPCIASLRSINMYSWEKGHTNLKANYSKNILLW